MLLLAISVTVVLTVSAFCSLSEAGLYAVRLPYIRKLVDRGSKAGPRLLRFKENIQQPIAAILILNTTANTAGATIPAGSPGCPRRESCLARASSFPSRYCSH